MNKKIFLPLILLFALCLTGCGNLVVMTRDLLSAENPSAADLPPHIRLDATDGQPAQGPDSTVNSDTAYDAILYEACCSFLPSLSDRERTIFLALYQGVLGFQESIPIPTFASSDEIKDLMQLLTNECPELLHLDSVWTQQSNLLGNVTAVNPSYTMDRKTYLAKRAAVENLLALFHTQLAGQSIYQTELALFDFIIDHCTYDTEAADCQNAYGALIGGRAKCDGRAKALVWGLRSFGVTCSVISGSNHAWVLARIEGYYYNVDPTYDDNEADGIQHPCAYTHFNVPESSIADDPYPADEFYRLRGYPQTIRWDANYHVRSGLWIPAGEDCRGLFSSLLEAAAQNGSGSISLRFERAEDFAAAQEAYPDWIQTYLNWHTGSCSIVTYDMSDFQTLFIELRF